MTTPSLANIPLGLCQCGCGQITAIAKETDKRCGQVRGRPVRYVSGHNATQRREDFSDAIPFKLDGVYCKLVQLTQGMYAIIWASDYEKVGAVLWSAHWDPKSKTFYATNNRLGGMHRFLLGLSKGDSREGDHVDSSRTWDNRRSNIRLAGRSQQNWNTRRRKDNTSGFKGVFWSKSRKKYGSEIETNGKRRVLGYDSDAVVCAEMYRVAALEDHGEFACVG